MPFQTICISIAKCMWKMCLPDKLKCRRRRETENECVLCRNYKIYILIVHHFHLFEFNTVLPFLLSSSPSLSFCTICLFLVWVLEQFRLHWSLIKFQFFIHTQGQWRCVSDLIAFLIVHHSHSVSRFNGFSSRPQITASKQTWLIEGNKCVKWGITSNFVEIRFYYVDAQFGQHIKFG